MTTTLVTAFLDLTPYQEKPRRPAEDYLRWGKHLLSFPVPAVVFIEPKWMEEMKDWRPPETWRVYPWTLETSPYISFRAQVQQDPNPLFTDFYFFYLKENLIFFLSSLFFLLRKKRHMESEYHAEEIHEIVQDWIQYEDFLSNLTDSELLDIFDFLDEKSLNVLCMVNVRFQNLCKYDPIQERLGIWKAQKLIQKAKGSAGTLILRRKHLKEVPPEIGELTSLWWLFLDHNLLTSLPPEIEAMTNLRMLDLSNNLFRSLPLEALNFPHLMFLNLSHNRLTSLSPEVGSLRSEYLGMNLGLNLSHNQLIRLPPEIGNILRLDILNISHNQLITLPREIGNLSRLKHLDLSSNQLTTLPWEIGNLSRLEELNLSYNQLITLPPKIGNLSRLEKLNLSYNPFTTLPHTLLRLPKISSIVVEGNRFLRVPEELHHLPWTS